MDKQQKNVYPTNQQQSVNYNLVNPLHLPQVPQSYQHAAQQHFYQVPPQPFMMHSPPAYPSYNVQPSQHFMMGPPPPYTAPSYSMAPQPMFHNVATAAIPTGYSVPITPQQTAIFDAGARFNGKGPVTIPPAPPGYLPNPAQVASMQGQTVMVEKKKNNFFTGGKGAGYTFW